MSYIPVCCLDCGSPHIAYILMEFKKRTANITKETNINKPNTTITSANIENTDEIMKIYDDLNIYADCCKKTISAYFTSHFDYL